VLGGGLESRWHVRTGGATTQAIAGAAEVMLGDSSGFGGRPICAAHRRAPALDMMLKGKPLNGAHDAQRRSDDRLVPPSELEKSAKELCSTLRRKDSSLRREAAEFEPVGPSSRVRSPPRLRHRVPRRHYLLLALLDLWHAWAAGNREL